MRPAAIVAGDVPVSYWQFFSLLHQKSWRKLTRSSFLLAVQKPWLIAVSHLYMASPRFGHPHSQNPSDTASYPDVSLSTKMCGQRKAGRTERASPAFCTLSMIPCDSSPVARHYRAKLKTKRLRRSVLVIWASPVTLTLTLTQIAEVI